MNELLRDSQKKRGCCKLKTLKSDKKKISLICFNFVFVHVFTIAIKRKFELAKKGENVFVCISFFMSIATNLNSVLGWI